MDKPLIIYHGHCSDGFCAAWLFHQVFPHAEFVPAMYGDDPPAVQGKDVYIVDFSYPREVLWRINAAAQCLTVLDHHKTAAAALEGFATECAAHNLGHPTIVFDMEKSGARLTWEFLHPEGKPSPWLVAYTEDRDLWKFNLDHSREINAALHSYDHSFEVWDTLHTIYPGSVLWRDLITQGSAILRRQQQIIQEHVQRAREITLAGHTILAVNATTAFSDIAGILAQGRPFGACWFINEKGEQQWSLRSADDGMDVSEIAKQFGGGGHTHAAGFTRQLYLAERGSDFLV